MTKQYNMGGGQGGGSSEEQKAGGVREVRESVPECLQGCVPNKRIDCICLCHWMELLGFLMYTYGHVWLWFSSSLGSLDYDRVEKSQGFGLG